jgi:CheY-like chemotaxis protein
MFMHSFLGSYIPQRKVLVVDDDLRVVRLVQAILEEVGFSVTAATGGGAAVTAYHSNGGIDLLITDIEMPGQNGIQLADELLKSQPGLPVLFITGGAAGLIGENRGACTILHKPFGPKELLATVGRLMGGA